MAVNEEGGGRCRSKCGGLQFSIASIVYSRSIVLKNREQFGILELSASGARIVRRARIEVATGVRIHEYKEISVSVLMHTIMLGSILPVRQL
jgi:hypothetical protein